MQMLTLRFSDDTLLISNWNFFEHSSIDPFLKGICLGDDCRQKAEETV